MWLLKKGLYFLGILAGLSIFPVIFWWGLFLYLSQPQVHVDSETGVVLRVMISEDGQEVEKPASWLYTYDGGYEKIYVMPEALRLEEEAKKRQEE